MNFIYPLSRYIKITQTYHSAHLGVDFGWNDGAYNHQPIVAIEDGYVVGCADGYSNTYPNQRIYGNYVNIKHDDNWFSMYGHLLKGLQRRLGSGFLHGAHHGVEDYHHRDDEGVHRLTQHGGNGRRGDEYPDHKILELGEEDAHKGTLLPRFQFIFSVPRQPFLRLRGGQSGGGTVKFFQCGFPVGMMPKCHLSSSLSVPK